MNPPSGPTLLLVDDDVRTARLLARMLRDDGFDVEVAADGAAAIARLSQGRVPDALITDIRMPHADGEAVARYARSRRADLPILVVTSYPQQAGGLEALVPPAMVFTKPLDYGELAA